VAQAIGRLRNWFNHELYGGPLSLPWAVAIDPAHRPPASPLATTYQPTFRYELVYDLGVAAVVAWAQRRRRLSGWASFALYAAAYTGVARRSGLVTPTTSWAAGERLDSIPPLLNEAAAPSVDGLSLIERRATRSTRPRGSGH